MAILWLPRQCEGSKSHSLEPLYIKKVTVGVSGCQETLPRSSVPVLW